MSVDKDAVEALRQYDDHTTYVAKVKQLQMKDSVSESKSKPKSQRMMIISWCELTTLVSELIASSAPEDLFKLSALWEFFPPVKRLMEKQSRALLSKCAQLIDEAQVEVCDDFNVDQSEVFAHGAKMIHNIFSSFLASRARSTGSTAADLSVPMEKLDLAMEDRLITCLLACFLSGALKMEGGLICGNALVSILKYYCHSDEDFVRRFMALMRMQPEIEAVEGQESDLMSNELVNLCLWTGLVHVGGCHVLLSEVKVSIVSGSNKCKSENQTLLFYLLHIVEKMCGPKSRFPYQSFCLLKLCCQRLEEICVQIERETGKNESQEIPDTVVKKITKIACANFENPIRGIPDLCHEAYKHLLVALSASWPEKRDVVYASLTFDRVVTGGKWSQKTTYRELSVLLSHLFNSKSYNDVSNEEDARTKILKNYPDFPKGLSHCLGSNHLTHAGTQVYKIILTGRGGCQPGYWSSTFGPVLVEALISDQSLVRTNATEYWLPLTLKHVDGSFHYIINKLNEITQDEACQNYFGSDHNFQNSLKEQAEFALQGVLSIIKICRKEGIPIENDFDAIFTEGIGHSSPDVRMTCFAILCECKKRSTPPDLQTVRHVIRFLMENLNEDSSRFRQSVENSFSILLARCRDYCAQMIRNMAKSKDPGWIELVMEFLDDVLSILVGNLMPGANYQRKILALRLLCRFEENFVNFTHQGSNKSSGNGDPTEFLMYANAKHKLMFTDKDTFKLLLLSCEDRMEDVREYAGRLLAHFKPDANDIKAIFHHSVHRLLSSPKERECESGAVLLKLCLTWDKEGAVMPSLLNDRNVFSVLMDMFSNGMDKARKDFLATARCSPLHGYVTAIRRLLLDDDSPVKLTLTETELESLLAMLEDTSKFMMAVLSGELVNSQDQPGLLNPSFQDMANSIDAIINSSFNGYEGDPDGDDGIDEAAVSEDHQLILACAWHNIKECALLSSKLLPAVTSSSLSRSSKGVDFLTRCANIHLSILKNCRHKGAIEATIGACGYLANQLLLSLNQVYMDIPEQMLKGVLSHVAAPDSAASVTRRAAGLPGLVQKLVAADTVTTNRRFLEYAVSTLLSIIQENSCALETQDSPAVLALHILRGLMSDSAVSRCISPYITEITATSLKSFLSESWSVRNAGLQLFGALVPRILGQKKVRDDSVGYNKVNVEDICIRLPGLIENMVAVLEQELETNQSYLVSGAVVPVLSILARLDGSKCESDVKKSIRNVMMKYIDHSVIQVRRLAASILVQFSDISSLSSMIIKLVKIQSQRKSTNKLHGYLLCLKEISYVEKQLLLPYKNLLQSIGCAMTCPYLAMELDLTLRYLTIGTGSAITFPRALPNGVQEPGSSYFDSRIDAESLASIHESPLGLPDFLEDELDTLSCLKEANIYITRLMDGIMMNKQKISAEETTGDEMSVCCELQHRYLLLLLESLEKLLTASYTTGHLISRVLSELTEEWVEARLHLNEDRNLELLQILEDTPKTRLNSFGPNVKSLVTLLKCRSLNRMLLEENGWIWYFGTDSSGYVSLYVDTSEEVLELAAPHQTEDARLMAGKCLSELATSLTARDISGVMPLVMQYGVVNFINASLILLQDEDDLVRSKVMEFAGKIFFRMLQGSAQPPNVSKQYVNLSNRLAFDCLLEFGMQQLLDVIEKFIPVQSMLEGLNFRKELLLDGQEKSHLFKRGDGVNVYQELSVIQLQYLAHIQIIMGKSKQCLGININLESLRKACDQILELGGEEPKEGWYYLGIFWTQQGFLQVVKVYSLLTLVLTPGFLDKKIEITVEERAAFSQTLETILSFLPVPVLRHTLYSTINLR